jgi:phage-related tail fiber protein
MPASGLSTSFKSLLKRFVPVFNYNPSILDEFATKTDVDALEDAINQLDYKASVRAASTANVDTASAPSTLDGVTLADGDRILLKDQSTASENGIYIFSSAGSALTRAADFDADAEVTAGIIVPVEEGSTLADTRWQLTTNDPIVVGTTNLTFAQFGGAGAPAAHATSHTDGTDDIQNATNAQKGLATAAHITALEANTASLAAKASTAVGRLHHVKVPAVGGAPGIDNVNWGEVVVPDGTWEIVDVHWVLRGKGTTGDSVQCYIDGTVSAYVTDAIDISSKSDDDVVRATSIDTANNVVVGDGSTQIMAAFATSSGNDCPPHDMHVTLRKTA